MDAKDLVDVLVEQNKTYKEMMQFAITSIITLLVIFLAANFFVMRKMRKDEIEKVKMEILQDIESTSLPNIHSQLDSQVTTLIGNKVMELESKINSLNNKVQGVSTMQNNLVEKTKDQIIKLDEKTKDQIIKIEADFYYLQGRLYELDKIHASAFVSYLDAGNKYVEIDFIAHIPHILNDMARCSEHLSYITSELSDFITFSNKISAEYVPQIDKVVEILKTKEAL